VTDANVVLGRIPADALLGGSVQLDAKLAAAAVARLAQRIGTTTELAARAILQVASAHALRGIRVLTARHAVDPDRLTLFAFGGAGPQFGCEWADELGIRRVVVPHGAGVTSAAGLLAAPPRIERARTVLTRLDDADERAVETMFLDLEARGARELAQRVARTARLASARYVGQGHELTVPVPPGGLADLRLAFDGAHEAQFGYRLEAPVELVTLRCRVEAEPVVRPERAASPPTRAAREGGATVPAWFLGGPAEPRPAARFDAAHLAPGSEFGGPAVVQAEDATTVIPPGWRARVDARGRILIEREAAS
jgi:N-methylhydantoinase A